MFTSDHYMPILTGKAGELGAIGQLTIAARMDVTPLLDIPPVRREHAPPPGAKPKPTVKPRTPEGELTKLLSRLHDAWGTERMVIVDLDGFERYRLSGLHPVAWFVDRASDQGLRVAIAVSSRSSLALRAAVRTCRDAVADVVVRLHAGELLDEPATALRCANEILAEMKLHPATTGLVIDLGRLPRRDDLFERTSELIAALAPARWEYVVLAGTSLPIFQDLPGDYARFHPRTDWDLWSKVASAADTDLAFADYGITGPRPDDDDPPHSPSPHLRYCTDDGIWVAKGKKNPGEDPPDPGTTYPELCAKLLALRLNGRRVFRGRDFSWGDQKIWEVGAAGVGFGSPRHYVEFATNHHLKQVVGQLSLR